jgi:hypothetical protein
MTSNTDPWWLRFDWGPELGLDKVDERAHIIADMCADCEQEHEEYNRYFDEIKSSMLRYYNQLN